ncbi:MAG: hypothetical protein ACK44D_08870 [Bacteroidia bacterium]
MRIVQLIITLLLIHPSLCFSQYEKVFGDYFQLQKGDSVFTFNKCVLKSKPDVNSKNIEKLNLGELLIIDSVCANFNSDTFIRPMFYRVKHHMKTGFIEQRNVSICKLNTNVPQDFFLVNQYSFSDTVPDSLKFIFVKNGIIEVSYIQKLIGQAYSITLTDNRGLDSITNLIQINYYAEACGEEGGVSILTWDTKKITELISLSSISDAGVFYSFETIVLPKDSGGLEGKIIYKIESGEAIDETTNWWKTIKEEREHSWTNKQVQPAFRSKPINE